MLKMLYDYQYRLNVFINVLYFLLFNNYNKITESHNGVAHFYSFFKSSASALALWLILFFCSAVDSAKVKPVSSLKKRGS